MGTGEKFKKLLTADFFWERFGELSGAKMSPESRYKLFLALGMVITGSVKYNFD